MIRYVVVLALPVLFFSCDVKRRDKLSDDMAKQMEQAAKDTTTVSIIDTSYNFGKRIEDDKIEYNYRFVNSGAKPLVIARASASCGCTVPERPEAPILPGDTGFIKVVFNSSGKLGLINKNIIVVANVRPPFPELLLTGEILEKQ